MVDGPTPDATSNSEPFPWPRAALVFLGTVVAYAILPSFEPTSIAAHVDIILVGIVLGLSVGLAIRVGERLTPAVSLGAAVAIIGRYGHDAMPLETTVLLGIGVGAEIWVMATLLRRTGAARLAAPVDVLMLLVVAIGVSLLTSGVGALVLAMTEQVERGLWWSVQSWAADDVFGIVCIAPAVILMHRPARWSWNHAVEYSIVTAITMGAATYIFFIVDHESPGLLGWPYLVILGPMWIAVRLGAAAVAPIIAVTFWLAALATANDLGAFSSASEEPLDRLVAAELFGIVIATTILLLGILRDDRVRSLARARESSRLLREVIDGSDSLVFAKSYDGEDSGQGRYQLVNERWVGITGLSREEAIGRSDAELFPPEEATTSRASDLEVLRSNAAEVVEEMRRGADGREHVYSSARFPLRDGEGKPWGVGGIATDVTESVLARDRERRSSELLRAVFELSPTPAVRLSVAASGATRAVDANAAMCKLMDAPLGDVAACDIIDRIHGEDREVADDVLAFALARSGAPGLPVVRKRELRVHTEDGRQVWVLMSAAAVGLPGADGNTEVVVQFEDITARRAAEEALTEQALRDVVTGLPNRRALHDRMQSALRRLRRNPGIVTVLFCDLDQFKEVNDSLGHQVGDLMLVEVARRIESALRPEDTVARLGGDEFVALVEGIAEPADAMLMALRMQDRVGAPWTYGDQAFRPAMSVGIAMTSDPEMSVDELLRRADLAMYRAKDAGRNRVVVYERSVDEEIQQAVAIQHDLRFAIDADGLVLLYQPIVRLDDATVIGAEALVRMRARDGTLIAPRAFIHQAESSGLVVPMGAWVIRRALADLHEWRARGRDLTMSVNVSPAQLRDEGFASFVLDAAEFARVDPRWLSVEVTETALLHDPGRSGRELTALSRAGVGISLDDFGTGYSSLSWLTQFPVNVVKIDKSFTDDVGLDDRKTAIVSAVIQVSHELGFTVVAEGVETAEQRSRLLDLGADRGQGYLFGRPTPVEDPLWT